MLPRRVMAVLLAAPVLLMTACGNAERDRPSDLAKSVSLPPVSPTINPAPPSSSSTAPTKAPASSAAAPSGSASAAPPGGGGGAEIKALIENKFDPPSLEVKVGTEVTWSNVAGFHSVTGGDGAPDAASPIGNTVLDTPGKTVKVTFDKPGTYPFFCTPHQALGMKGQVVVT